MNQLIKLTDQEYFSHSALSNSFLKNFDRSPAHSFTEKESSKRMELGSALHCYLLEPELFPEKVIIAPDIIKIRRGKEWDNFSLDVSPDCEIFLFHEWQKLKPDFENIKRQLFDYKIIEDIKFGQIIDKCQKEISMFWIDETLGEPVEKKAKMDLFYELPSMIIIIDLKMTDNCLSFERKVSDRVMKYYRQDAWYSEGCQAVFGKPAQFIFLTFEDKAPYGVKAYQLDPEYLEYGKHENDKSVLRYLDWQNSGADKSMIYPHGIEMICKPKFL